MWLRMGRRQRTKRARKRGGRTDWARVAGEAALLAVVVFVPVAINRASPDICDVKDVALGLGVALGLSLWVLASLARGRMAWVRSRLSLPVIAFGVWAGATISYSGYRYATVSEFGRLAAHIGLYLLVVVSLRTAAQVRRLIGTACVVAVPVCIYGFVQAAGKDPVLWDTAPGRVFSFLGNATYLASFLVLLIPVAVAVGWPRAGARGAGGTSGKSSGAAAASAMFLGVAAMMLLCLYFSVTLSPGIGLGLGAVMAGVLSVVRGGRALVRAAIPWIVVGIVIAAGLGVVGYQHLPEEQQRRVQKIMQLRDPSGRQRVLLWRVGLDLFQERPVLGLGYGTYAIYSLERLSRVWYRDLRRSPRKMLVPSYAHNEYLQVLAGTGVVGGAIFLLLLVTMYGAALRVSLRHTDEGWRRIGMGIAVAATAFLFQNFFGVTFRQTGAVTFFWLWLGVLALAAAWIPAPGEERAEPRVRQVQFAPLSFSALVLAALGLLCVLIVLGWYTVRPVAGNMKLRAAKRQADKGKAFPEGQEEARERQFEMAAELAEEATRLSPYSAPAYYTAGYAWGELGEYDKALAATKRALELLPANASFEYNLGVTYLAMGDMEKAEASFARAIELMPTSAKHHGAMADILLQQGRIEEAVPYAREALRLTPEDPKCRMLMADVEARRGNLPRVVRHLRAATRLDPDDVSARRQLCELLLRLKKYRQAVSACRVWVRLDPTSARAWQGLGVAYFKVRDYEAAEKAFARAVEIGPGSARARLRLAHSNLALGKSAQAAREFEEVVRLRPKSREAAEARAMLDRMRRGGARRARR